jgi:hypothetical protein
MLTLRGLCVLSQLPTGRSKYIRFVGTFVYTLTPEELKFGSVLLALLKTTLNICGVILSDKLES